MAELQGGWFGVRLGVLGLVVAASGGCSQQGYSGPTGTVAESVTLDGKPVPQGCLISFVSAEGRLCLQDLFTVHTEPGPIGPTIPESHLGILPRVSPLPPEDLP